MEREGRMIVEAVEGIVEEKLRKMLREKKEEDRKKDERMEELEGKTSLLLKGVLLVSMIASNTVGCTFFVKALHGSGSSLPITVASAATNYVCSAFVGSVVFDESTSLTWWCGTSLVLLGLMLICNVPAEKKASAVVEKLKRQ